MEDFKQLKKAKNQHFMILEIDSKKGQIYSKHMQNSTQEEPEDAFEIFAEYLLENFEKKPAYVVLDFDFEKSGGKKNKLILVSWVPDESPPMSKMVYATTATSAKNSLVGVHKLVQVNDEKSLSYKNFVSKM
ncbi:hypothetical protein MHBO_001182 [Bonamia ostreae]|uniref:ADF-H domain-containing protein n=1 Tax=Bonamia ostreae TaxID=126728 RepID=A0ABV2AI94_9EUKA